MSGVAHWSSYPATTDRLLSFIGIEIHWAILQYVIGLPFMAFIALLLAAKRNDQHMVRFAKTLTKGFIIVFAIGAATGTASEFGLVLLWPHLTEAAGRYIYFPLYMEIFAFLMEVVFLYMLWYGWNRFSPKALAAVAFLGFLGAWYSASMILSVNSYMVAPTGIVPAYEPQGVYLYSQGYPKMTVYLPSDIVPLLNVTALQKAAHVEVKGVDGNTVEVLIPARVVQELVREAWTGVKLQSSILAHFLNRTTIAKLSVEDVERLAAKLGVQLPQAALASNQDPAQLLLQLPVKNILDYILITSVKKVGYMSITFKSPVYITTLMHTIGSALTVSGFTVLAGYALRLLRMPRDVDPDYAEYVRKAFKFAAVFAAVVIAYQGFIAGHEMGRAIAEWNPEKFAAIEGTSSHITSFSRLLHTDKIMPWLAYGSSSAKLPEYDRIPADYCKCMLTGTPPVQDCRPPIFLHYIYYTKIGLAILLGLYGLIVALAAIRDKIGPLAKLLDLIGIRSDIPGRTWLALALLTPVVAQAVSTMGWVVREVGRKPWTIYGVMTVNVARTFNPAPAWQLALVATFFIAVALALVYAVYRILWIPGRPKT
jgi:cytochrome d ubiquinol oxidase subunit I